MALRTLSRYLYNTFVQILVVYFQFRIHNLEKVCLHIPSDRQAVWVGRHGSYLMDLACTSFLMKRSNRSFRIVCHRSWHHFSWIFADDDTAPVPCIDTSMLAFQKALTDGHDVIVYPGGILETLGGKSNASADCRYNTSWEGRTRFGTLAVANETYVVPFLVKNQEDIYFKPLARLSRYLWKTCRIIFILPLGIGFMPFPLEMVLHTSTPFGCRGMEASDVVAASRTGISQVARNHQRATHSKVYDILQHIHVPTAGSLLVLHCMVLYLWFAC
jgi:hypothetical protein